MIRLLFAASISVFAINLWAGGGQDERQTHPGVYAVPVTPAELIRYSLFSDLDIEVRKASTGLIKIEYSLPLELTGVENRIELEGMPDGTNVLNLTGVNGLAKCEFDTAIRRCELAYRNLTFNASARDQLLEQIANGDANAVTSMKSVASQFEQMIIDSGTELRGGEVHGILVIQ